MVEMRFGLDHDTPKLRKVDSALMVGWERELGPRMTFAASDSHWTSCKLQALQTGWATAINPSRQPWSIEVIFD